MTDTPTTAVPIALLLRREAAIAEALRFLEAVDDDLQRLPAGKRGKPFHTQRLDQRRLLLARLAALGILN